MSLARQGKAWSGGWLFLAIRLDIPEGCSMNAAVSGHSLKIQRCPCSSGDGFCCLLDLGLGFLTRGIILGISLLPHQLQNIEIGFRNVLLGVGNTFIFTLIMQFIPLHTERGKCICQKVSVLFPLKHTFGFASSFCLLKLLYPVSTAASTGNGQCLLQLPD